MDFRKKTREELLLIVEELQEEVNSLKLDKERTIFHNKQLEYSLNEVKSKSKEGGLPILQIMNDLSDNMVYQLAELSDKKRQFMFVSDTVKKFYGCTPDEAKADANLIYGKFKNSIQRIREEGRAALKNMSVFKTELKIQNPDGTYRWSSIVSTPWLLNGITYWNGIETDITEQKDKEQELFEAKIVAEECEARFRNIFEHTSVGKSLGGIDGNILMVNKAYCNFIGYTQEELQTMSWRDITFTEDISRSNDLINSLLDKRTDTVNLEKKYRHKNGTTVWAFVTVYLQRDKDGRAEYYITTIIDITHLKFSEEKIKILSLAIEQNPASIVITDSDGVIEYINSKFSKLTGYSFNEAIGKNPSILKSGKTSQEEYRDLWETITSGNIWHGSFQNRKKNGDSYYENAIISPIIDEEGHITNYLSVKEDITDRVQSEKHIRTLDKAIEQSPSSIIITNAEGKIEFMNKKFRSSMQYTLKEVKGKQPRIFNPGHQPKELYDLMWKTLRSGKVWEGEFLNRKKDKSHFWENVIISPLLNKDGSISNYIIIMEDITEKKKMINDLIKAKEKAEESDRLKTAFLHNISHEIRTPMNAIIGFSTFLGDPDLDDYKRKQFIEIITKSSNQLLSIITDIINISTIEAGQERISEFEFDLHSTLCHIGKEFLLIAQKQNISINLVPFSDLKENRIITDETKLIQIIHNLLVNALKFTKQGHINFGYIIKGTMIEFFVEDTGIGIPPDMHEEIFKRFSQVDTSSTRNNEGSGLGLSISKAYVKLLGGKIWLNSTLGKGSTFYFTIPYKKTITNIALENEQQQ
jgi:PAS domain S-box-containing protein